MINIHPTAIVDSKANLGNDVQVGPFAVIEAEVEIGGGTEIGPHTVIANGSTLGRNCKISPGAVIGTAPQDLKYEGEKTFVVIGDNTTIRECATVNRATTHSYYTRVGNDCLLMAYSHVAHDCILGNNVVIANSVNMAGHITIDDYAGVGGITPIHQFVHIGAYAFIGGGLRVSKDVPPFILAMGDPLRFGGLNRIGLIRRGFDDARLKLLKQAYKILYRSKLTTDQAIREIESGLEINPDIEYLLKFLKASERGIIR